MCTCEREGTNEYGCYAVLYYYGAPPFSLFLPLIIIMVGAWPNTKFISS